MKERRKEEIKKEREEGRKEGREGGREQHAFCLGKVRGRLTAHTIPRDKSYTKHSVNYAPWSCAVLWPWVRGVTEEKSH